MSHEIHIIIMCNHKTVLTISVQFYSVYPFHWIHSAGTIVMIVIHGVGDVDFCNLNGHNAGWCQYFSSKGRVPSCSVWLGLHWNTCKKRGIKSHLHVIHKLWQKSSYWSLIVFFPIHLHKKNTTVRHFCR